MAEFAEFVNVPCNTLTIEVIWVLSKVEDVLWSWDDVAAG
jgi:hypothetical protein